MAPRRRAGRRNATRNRAFTDFQARYEDIQDPNLLRRLVLADIDDQKFGWAQMRAILVAGTGFLTDSFDIFAINLVTDMIGIAYFLDPATGSSNMPQSSETAIKVATSVGTLIGQVFFGWLADVVGRKRMYGYELLIIVLATFGQCISGPSPAISITGLLVFWRITMGLGIGGDYPLSSILVSENANTKLRGTMMAAVFATQALGQFIASIVTLIVTSAFKNTQLSSLNNTQKNYCHGNRCYYPSPSSVIAADRMWRIIVGFGAIPASFALYFRLTIPETPRYTFDVSRDSEQGLADYRAWVQNSIGPRNSHGHVASEREPNRTRLNNEPLRGLNQEEVPQSSWPDFKRHFGQWKNFQVLLGTCGTWFTLDAAYYALTLNNTVFLQKVGFGSVGSGKNYSLYTFLREGAVGNLILATAGGIPGSVLTVLLIDKIGRKPILMLGFAMTTLLLLILGSAFSHMTEASRMALYVLTLFFFNFGPNAITFIVPGECFPTRYRSTSHGISAAFGKLGAVLAQSLTGPLRGKGSTDNASDPSIWLPHVVQILAAFTFIGFLLSFLIPETVDMTLEQLGSGKMSPRYRWLHVSKVVELFTSRRANSGYEVESSPDIVGENNTPAANEQTSASFERPASIHTAPKSQRLRVDTFEMDDISSSSRSAKQEVDDHPIGRTHDKIG